MKKGKLQDVLRLVVLIVALVIVVSLFSLPIIISMLPDNRDDHSNITNTINTNDIINCDLQWGQLPAAVINTTCIQYTGTVCHHVLNTWQVCTNTDRVLINETEDTLTMTEREQRIIDITSFLGNHKECHEVAFPFLCQYYFPLYNCNISLIYKATIEECIVISTGVCSQIWNVAVAFGYESLLPNCNNLPTAFMPHNGSNYTNNSNISDETSLLSNVTCREDFIDINSSGICQPRCDRFEQSSHTGTVVMLYSELITSIIGLLIAIIVIVLSIRNYKRMLKYPSVLLLLIVADYSIIAILAVITAVDRSGLLCSSISLLESINHPTIFCTLSGALFHYALVNMSLVWLFHVIIFFHKVVFPFHAHQMETNGRNKFILITVIILAFAIPLPAVILCLSVKEYEYRIRRFPPTICFSNTTEVWFYSGVLLMDIVVCVGVCLLIVIFFVLHKEKKKYHSSGRSIFNTAERKIIIVFCSIILFSVFALGDLSNYVAKSNKFTSALTDYFTCESLGHVPGQCNRGEFTGIYTPYTTVVSQYLMALIPLTILNYIIKWEAFKKTALSALKLFQRKEMDRPTTAEVTKTVDAFTNSSEL